MDNYTPESIALCSNWGNGFVSAVIKYRAVVGVLAINSSGYPRFTYLGLDYQSPYESLLTGLFYTPHDSVYPLPGCDELSYPSIHHDLALAADDTPHVCLLWGSYNASQKLSNIEMAYTRKQGSSWPFECFYKTPLRYRHPYPLRLALTANGVPQVFGVLASDHYRDSDDDPYYRLVMYSPDG
jgi:hypothetical protein